MADLSSLLNPAPSSSSPPRPEPLQMDSSSPQHKRKDSITSPGLDALAAAASSSARLVSPPQNSPPSYTLGLGGIHTSGFISQSGLEQLGEAAASVQNNDDAATTQIREPMPGPEQNLPALAVPDTQSEQVHVKTEMSDVPVEEAYAPPIVGIHQ